MSFQLLEKSRAYYKKPVCIVPLDEANVGHKSSGYAALETFARKGKDVEVEYKYYNSNMPPHFFFVK